MDYLSTNRIKIPVIGFGTWDVRGEKGRKAIERSIENGYRLIDTASYYENEEIVGKAVRNSIEKGLVNREDLFITTKIWPNEFSDPETAIERSMSKLGLDYVDLYLVHWPQNSLDLRTRAYNGLEKALEEGITKYIGVSNYSIEQIEELADRSSTPPAVNQVHVSPFRYPRPLIEYCQDNEIVIEAYTPLEHGRQSDNRTLRQIAENHDKTPEQVMLRWSVQKGLVPLPKANRPEHQRLNLDIFDFVLGDDEMRMLDNLP